MATDIFGNIPGKMPKILAMDNSLVIQDAFLFCPGIL
jgi:hypothetical protein